MESERGGCTWPSNTHSFGSVLPLWSPASGPLPLPLKTQFPQGTQPKQTPQRKSPSPSSVRGKKGMHVQSGPCGTCEAVGCAGRLLWLRGRAVSMMWWWVKPVRLLSCEVSVIFSQQVPCGVWECLFSGSIMSSAHSLPGAGNLRVEIVPDEQTSFVRKTAVTSVITESDYSGPAALRIPLAWTQSQVRGRVTVEWDAVWRRSGLKDLTYSSKNKHWAVCVKGVWSGDWLDRWRREGSVLTNMHTSWSTKPALVNTKQIKTGIYHCVCLTGVIY